MRGFVAQYAGTAQRNAPALRAPPRTRGGAGAAGREATGVLPAGRTCYNAARAQTRDRPPEPQGVSKSVLIVEDEPNIVLSLEFLMKQEGHDVRVARDGAEALQSVATVPPDLVLLDVMIPERDGYDVCQTIRANPDWQAVRILMLTAKGREVEREKGLALGADDYITKPFSTRELVEKVKSLLAAGE